MYSFNSKLHYIYHFNISKQISSGIHLLKCLTKQIRRYSVKAYFGIIFPRMSHDLEVWGAISIKKKLSVFDLQKSAKG